MSVITINQTEYPIPDDPRTTLLDFLHQHLSMFGTKKGCDHGQCGSCTVLVDGKRVNSCLVFAFQLEDCSVTTIEGISEEGALHPVQQAFIDNDAFQCGYCTPGQICSSVAVMSELARGEPSTLSFDQDYTRKEDLKERMSGNLCRCGAYPNILAAVEEVMEKEATS
ncbi:2Fe-2S iron-sulfur cluster binding domain-containing protein [Alteromonas pelagimontana]|uniref:2Fe-2S iron-sulfur cluster binding domain-containing protein n=1 Tax=Alteromonas pelagimontana TaxID=1858656 RepID=A0A6M4MF31_9ALTE|nr:2Fe-2S iron-sulfur cluster-binding protein [Alteromonas pelagimontana]QJR81215.1 2Fe-2S iron-sulfur cluster binding domain-containing protein [Alteromonas pelagimontana]